LSYYVPHLRKEGIIPSGRVDILRTRNGETSPFYLAAGATWWAAEADQSKFARDAGRLWGAEALRSWVATLAEVYDSLLDSSAYARTDPLLKLQIARRFLELAVKTSDGYKQLLEKRPDFGKVTGGGALLQGNWLEPKNDDDLRDSRKNASEFLKEAPRLTGLAAEAAARDDLRRESVRRGIAVAGWLGRDDSGRPAVDRFAAVEPPEGGGSLYVLDERRWVPVGKAGARGKVESLDESARGYLGWPVFVVSAVE
jgi:hypothetical protein